MHSKNDNPEGIKLQATTDGIDVVVTKKDKTNIRFYETVVELLADINVDDCIVVADNKVLELFHKEANLLLNKCKIVGIDVSEKEKSWKNLETILDSAIKANISRKGAIIALGGGVITDISGLASNLYFRGIRTILIPTTLLAMVDAAIGGKVAVNHPFQKNLLGSFYHPSQVLISTEFLSTVSPRHIHSAAGEIIKLAILSSSNLLELIESAPSNWIKNQQFLTSIVKISVAEKLRMLGENCFERDLKRPLNLGHSVAHPVEDITNYSVLHGEAVSFGVLIACSISMQRGLLKQKDYQRIYEVATSFGAATFINDYNVDELWQRMNRLISQRGGKGLLYVLPTGIGSTKIVKNIAQKELFLAISQLSKLHNARKTQMEKELNKVRV